VTTQKHTAGALKAAQYVMNFLQGIDWSTSSESWKHARLAEIISAETGERALLDALQTIADFAVGNGDVCEIIARRAHAAIRAAEGELEPESDMERERR